jgi:hypothetical protein
MKTALLLSTFDENVGDDLIRHGVEHLLEQVSPGPWRYERWAKSNAISASFAVGPLSTATIHRRGGLVRMAMGRAERASMSPFNPWRFQKLLRSDLVLVCGTPLFYFTAAQDFADAERWPAIILHAARTADPPPIVTLGCGSILYRSVEETRARFPRGLAVVRDVVECQSLFVCRDRSTEQLIRAAGVPQEVPIPVLPCPSVWAADRLGIGPAAAGRTLCISFSTESSTWSDPGDRDVEIRVGLFAAAVAKTRSLGLEAVALAHNDLDVAAVMRAKRSRTDLDGVPVVRVDAAQLLERLRTARGLITWRVHGAAAARSLGIPALLFRTDSRVDLAAGLGATVVDNESSSVGAVDAFLDAAADARPPAGEAALRALKENAVGTLRGSWQDRVADGLRRGRT